MLTEVELAEALLATLDQQREAIVCARLEELAVAVERGEELSRPIEALENERMRITAELMEMIAPGHVGNQPCGLTEVVPYLNKEDGVRVTALGKRLRNVIGLILKVNQENKPLIDHSLRFVRENLRIIRENYSKQLIDQKM